MITTTWFRGKNTRRINHYHRANYFTFHRHLSTSEVLINRCLLAEFDKEKVQVVILDRFRDMKLLRLLRHSPKWIIDYADAQSMILVRAN